MSWTVVFLLNFHTTFSFQILFQLLPIGYTFHLPCRDPMLFINRNRELQLYQDTGHVGVFSSSTNPWLSGIVQKKPGPCGEGYSHTCSDFSTTVKKNQLSRHSWANLSIGVLSYLMSASPPWFLSGTTYMFQSSYLHLKCLFYISSPRYGGI